jgi:hypothetical protein
MLSCQSAVAAVDALPILSCRVPAVGPIMMMADGTRNNKLHNTASRLCGDTLPNFEASTTCDGWCRFTDSLSSEFFYSSIRDLASCRHW